MIKKLASTVNYPLSGCGVIVQQTLAQSVWVRRCPFRLGRIHGSLGPSLIRKDRCQISDSIINVHHRVFQRQGCTVYTVIFRCLAMWCLNYSLRFIQYVPGFLSGFFSFKF